MKTFVVSFLLFLASLPLPVLASSSGPRGRVALVTGGCRGIGKGIAQVFAACGEYDALLLTYNTNKQAAEELKAELPASIQVELVGGDLTTQEARDAIFDCLDQELCDYDLATVVHNAGQYLGITADNVEGITAERKVFANGSLLLNNNDGGETLDTSQMDYYQKLYGSVFVEICERSLIRMKQAYERCQEAGSKYGGCIIGISSPGCNHNYRTAPGYDMPGSGKCVMEYMIRLYALAVAKYGINCNVVVPGITESDGWGKMAASHGTTKEQFMNGFVSRAVPAGEIIAATDIGDMVQFLASTTGGGRFVTGLSLRVDGGMHLK